MKFTTSLFSQILQVMPRPSFLRLVHECGAERHAKGFSSWDQFVAMLFCQLAQCKSLREISDGLAVTCGKSVIWECTLLLPRVRFLTRMPIVPGSFIRIFSFICVTCFATRAPERRRNSASRTSCSASIPPPSTFVSVFFPGLNSAKPKAPSSFICYWTTTVICPTSPLSLMARLSM